MNVNNLKHCNQLTVKTLCIWACIQNQLTVKTLCIWACIQNQLVLNTSPDTQGFNSQLVTIGVSYDNK
jgi:hypothetical protein